MLWLDSPCGKCDRTTCQIPATQHRPIDTISREKSACPIHKVSWIHSA